MLRPQSTLRGRLLCLLLVAAFPVVILVLAGAYAGYRSAVEQNRHDLALQRDVMVAVMAGRIATAEGSLRALAAVWPRDHDGCGDWLAAAATEGVMLDVGCGGAADPIDPALRARLRTSPNGLIQAESGGAITVLRALPQAAGLLLARVAPPPLPGGLLGWVVDANGTAWPMGPAEAALGLPEAGAEPAEIQTADGTRLIAARGSLGSATRIVVAQPAGPMRDAAAMTALQRLAEVAALLGLSVLAVLFGAQYAVVRPLSRLRRAVARWRGGAAFEIPDAAGMPEEIRDLAESFQAGAVALAQREVELQAAITRAEILAAEVHHRVKNNLQIVSSLLALQAQRITDEQARREFEAARDRIGALATLHRHMYAHHDPEAIDLAAFIEELGAQLFAAVGDKPGRRIALDVTAPALRISSDQAVPLALIITEAVSAALKQGFPGRQGGRIAIHVGADDRRATLAIEDDGVIPRQDDQLRALLLRGLARQLGGELRREEAGLTLEFPLRPANPRPPPSIRPTIVPAADRPAPSAPA